MSRTAASVNHRMVAQHQHPFLPAIKKGSVQHFDCSCGLRCVEPHVWALHIEAEMKRREDR